MARNFKELEGKMGPERMARVRERVKEEMTEMLLSELRRASGMPRTSVSAIARGVSASSLPTSTRVGTPMPPSDPLIYRFYELVMVNGPAWKALIEEEFGDGIMSAIDFDLQMERLPNPKGDRVKITMSGKFLPYRYYGNSGNVPDYGFKEE